MSNPFPEQAPASPPTATTEPNPMPEGVPPSSATAAPPTVSSPSGATEPAPRPEAGPPSSATAGPRMILSRSGELIPEYTPEMLANSPSLALPLAERQAMLEAFLKDPAGVCFGKKKAAAPQPSTAAPEPPPAPEPEPLPALDLLKRIARTIRSCTHAPRDICAALAIFAFGTFFGDCHPTLPCLVIAGPPHQATQLLRALQLICCRSALLPAFRRTDVADYSNLWTLLLLEPDMTSRTAALLGAMANSNFTSADGYRAAYARSIAVYVGERSPVGLIPCSIGLTLQPTDTVLAPPIDRSAEIETLRQEISRYRDAHLDEVRQRAYHPAGLSPEMAEIARTVGSCIVGAPEVQQRIVRSLVALEKSALADWSFSEDSLVAEAVRNLSRGSSSDHLFASEIAAEANRLLELRGEKLRLSPEKIGHRLRRLGLPTRRLSQAGNGLLLDAATRAGIEGVVTKYVMEDWLTTEDTEEAGTDRLASGDDASQVVTKEKEDTI